MQRNPIGYSITQYLSKFALPLGGWFILEYLVRNYAAYHLMLNLLSLPMVVGTITMLYYSMRGLRDRLMPEGRILGIHVWTFGIQMMLFAGLLEAMFVWLFNSILVPDNLYDVHEAMLQQFQSTTQLAQSSGLNTGFLGEILSESADVLQEQPIPTPIEAAMSALSNDIFAGMILMIPIALLIRRK